MTTNTHENARCMVKASIISASNKPHQTTSTKLQHSNLLLSRAFSIQPCQPTHTLVQINTIHSYVNHPTVKVSTLTSCNSVSPTSTTPSQAQPPNISWTYLANNLGQSNPSSDLVPCTLLATLKSAVLAHVDGIVWTEMTKLAVPCEAGIWGLDERKTMLAGE